MMYSFTDLAFANHHALLAEVEQSRRARRAAANHRLQRRAERLARRAERASHRANRAAARARLTVARAL